MAEHRATVVVNAPLHQVYELYTHFNDYPKFMTFVKEVTYLDDQRSHWVVNVAGTHAWDAVNEGWIPDRQIGWRSLDGLNNSGRATFESAGPGKTRVTVDISYDPPAGLLGKLGEMLGAGGQFERALQHDLEHFAKMVDAAPPGALDPTSSSYLFHDDSAAAQGRTTKAQDESMGITSDPQPPASTTSVTSGALGPSAIGGDSALADPTVPRLPGTAAAGEDDR